MDQDRKEKIIGAVQSRLGITLPKDDPLFALVVMNELVLDDMLSSAASSLSQSEEKIAAIIGGVVQAATLIRSKSSESIEAETAAAISRIQAEAADLSKGIKSTVQQSVSTGLKDAASGFKQATEESTRQAASSIAGAVSELQTASTIYRAGLWEKLGYFVVAALVSGVVAAFTVHWMAPPLTDQEIRAYTYAKKLNENWESLTAEERKVVSKALGRVELPGR